MASYRADANQQVALYSPNGTLSRLLEEISICYGPMFCRLIEAGYTSMAW
jgi:hypothetical protein